MLMALLKPGSVLMSMAPATIKDTWMPEVWALTWGPCWLPRAMWPLRP